MTFRACSLPAPTRVKPQPALAILSQESVHTMLSITHHTRKRPSTGPPTIHGPQSHPWWVHWQHTHLVTKEKRKRKEMSKRNSNKWSKAETKAKNKITWKRKVSDPLGKGNDLTHLRQNYAQEKSANHQTNARKPQWAPPAHMQAPPEPMQLALDECMQTTWWKQSSCISSALTGQTGQHHWSDRCAIGEQSQHSDRSDRWPQPVRPVHNRAQKWFKTTWKLSNAFSSPKNSQTSPPWWQCMNEAKIGKNAT
jgi:hypothetical protein